MICPAASWAETEGTTVFLLRHAEKAAASSDPPLSTAGQERARELARTLRDAGIRHIHSTDYSRTRDTVAPIADLLELEIKIYDPHALEAFAEALKGRGGKHLVVGHSNTTPKLVELLGGEPGTEIDEPGEYDRLYIVSIADDGAVSTTLLRYGQPFQQ